MLMTTEQLWQLALYQGWLLGPAEFALVPTPLPIEAEEAQ